MTARSAVLAGQRAAERNMIDRVDVVRVVRVRDPLTYVESDEEIPVWSGRCKVQSYEPDTTVVSSAGVPVALQEYRLHVPVDAGPFEVGDVCRVDGWDRPFRVDGVLTKTFMTAQRLKVTLVANSEVTRG